MAGVSRGEINAMHERLSRSFGSNLRNGCDIAPMPESRQGWHRRALMADIEFFLWSRNRTQQYGLRSGGRGQCPIVSAIETSDDWDVGEFSWVAWREIWIRKKDDEFDLKDAAFTFFWGRETGLGPIDDQLFRVEWPQKGYGGDRLGRPHWQVDWPLADLERSVSGIHLAMAGWNQTDGRNLDGEPHISEHFIRYATDVISDIEIWASRTMAYSFDQIARFFPRNWG